MVEAYYLCPLCERKSTDPDGLRNHMYYDHSWPEYKIDRLDPQRHKEYAENFKV